MPTFSAPDQHGNVISNESLLGQKYILYFYPKDDTSGCTAQACNLRDNSEILQQHGYRIIGVSVDDMDSHHKFIRKHDLPFSLLADTDHAIVNAFGVWGEKNMYGRKYMGTHRVTFVIDEKGVIERVISKVKTKKHAEQILQ